MKNDVPIKKLSKTYKIVKESDIHSIRLRGTDLQNETIQVWQLNETILMLIDS